MTDFSPRRLLTGPFKYLRTAARLLLLNTDLRPHEFFILPLSPLGDLWAVRKKKGPKVPWTLLRLRRGTRDFKTFSKLFIQEGYRLSKLRQWEGIRLEYDRLVAKGKTPLILDCGANVGLAAVYFQHLFPEARILAVEPEKGNFERLSLCLKGEGPLPLLGAVSAKEGAVEVLDPGLGQDAFRTRRRSRPGPRTLPAYSIPKLIREGRKKGAFPFLVKIDIEGFEKDLFASNTRWVASFKVMAIELHDRYFPGTSNSSNFLKVVARAPRDFIHLGETIFSIRNDR